MRDKISWVAMFIIGAMLIIMGFQGSLGRVLACFFTPSEVIVN